MFASISLRHLRRSSFAPVVLRKQQLLSPFRKLNSQFGSDSGQTKGQARRAELFGKFGELFRKYGYVFVGTYLGIYVSTLASVYFALEMDVMSASTFGYDAQTLIKKGCDTIEFYTGNKSVPDFIRGCPAAGVFMIAWALTKFTEPFRLGAALLIVPRIAKYLRRVK